MKVLLLSPPSRVMNHYRPPLALMYLSGYLQHKGIASQIIDITLKEQIRDSDFYRNKLRYLEDVKNKTLDQVKNTATDIVGITCYTPEFDEVSDVALKIKQLKPNVKVVVGGIHPTLYPRDFFYPGSPFDYAVIGEGEAVFLDLVHAIRQGTLDFSQVKGLSYFDRRKNQIVVNSAQDLIEDLDAISFPDYRGVDMKFYTTPSPYAIRGVFTKSTYISSSRGCPSSCAFCVSKKLREYHGVKRFVRLRSPKSLFDEIIYLKKEYGIDSFYFIDDLFTLKKESVKNFCRFLIENKANLIWGCSSKVNTVDYEMLKIMSDAGCVQIDFGVERGSDRSLIQLKKGINIAQVKQTFSWCRKLNIRTFANMLVNVPGENEEDLYDILRFVEKLRPNIVSFNLFTPYPGCEIFDDFCRDFEKKDYRLLMEPPTVLIEKYPQRFRFASHSVDLTKWSKEATKKYNRLLPNLKIYFDQRYIKNIIMSKSKKDYFRQMKPLIREFITQKF